MACAAVAIALLLALRGAASHPAECRGTSQGGACEDHSGDDLQLLQTKVVEKAQPLQADSEMQVNDVANTMVSEAEEDEEDEENEEDEEDDESAELQAEEKLQARDLEAEEDAGPPHRNGGRTVASPGRDLPDEECTKAEAGSKLEYCNQYRSSFSRETRRRCVPNRRRGSWWDPQYSCFQSWGTCDGKNDWFPTHDSSGRIGCCPYSRRRGGPSGPCSSGGGRAHQRPRAPAAMAAPNFCSASDGWEGHCYRDGSVCTSLPDKQCPHRDPKSCRSWCYQQGVLSGCGITLGYCSASGSCTCFGANEHRGYVTKQRDCGKNNAVGRRRCAGGFTYVKGVHYN